MRRRRTHLYHVFLRWPLGRLPAPSKGLWQTVKGNQDRGKCLQSWIAEYFNTGNAKVCITNTNAKFWFFKSTITKVLNEWDCLFLVSAAVHFSIPCMKLDTSQGQLSGWHELELPVGISGEDHLLLLLHLPWGGEENSHNFVKSL